jgi:urea transport system permease protein
MRHLRCGIVLLIALLWGALTGVPAVKAQDFESALSGFTADSYSDTDSAIAAVAKSGNPLAIPLIEALQDGRLLFSAQQKRVYFKDRAGAVLDAATGKPVSTPPGDLSPVRVNNRVRRAIDAAVGSLTLLSPDPARRLDAAQAVFKSKDANALGPLETAIKNETNPTIRRALIEARAAVILFKPDASETEKIEAVGVMRQRGDQDALALLSSLPAGTPDGVKRTAQDAIAAIQTNLAMLLRDLPDPLS